MKILFIGPYRQPDEWGRKSRSVLQALKKIDNAIVTSRPIWLSNSMITYDNYTESAEFVIESDYDILIQFLLPSLTVYDGNFSKRIGIFNTETIPYNLPKAQLTGECLMDEVWTDSIRIRDSLQTLFDKYETNTKAIAISPTLDVQLAPSDLNQSIRTTNKELQDQFLFYYIGNILDNKSGFQETCLAYLSTFTNSDPTTLIIGLETNISPDQINAVINQYRKMVQTYIPVSKQATIHVVSPQNQILDPIERASIHMGSDCLISVGYAFSANTTVLEGAMYHRTPIVTKHNACYEWFGNQHLWGVESYDDLCTFATTSPIPRFTVGELWNKPIVKSLAEMMSHVYINKFERDKKQAANISLRSTFEQMTYSNFVNGEIL